MQTTTNFEIWFTYLIYIYIYILNNSLMIHIKKKYIAVQTTTSVVVG